MCWAKHQWEVGKNREELPHFSLSVLYTGWGTPIYVINK